MKHWLIRSILLMLALLMLCSPLAGCQTSKTDPVESKGPLDEESSSVDATDTEDSNTEDSNTEESTDSEQVVELIQLVVQNVSLVSIVYPVDYTDTEYAAAKNLWNFIVDNSSVKPKLQRDTDKPEEGVIEILVGDTKRTADALQRDALPIGTYVVELVGNSLVINGAFDGALEYAVTTVLAGIKEHGMKEEGMLQLPDTVLQSGYLPPFVKEMFSFGSTPIQSLVECGNGCYMLFFEDVKPSDFSAYYGMLLDHGMESYEDPRMMLDTENNFYASCTDGTFAVTMIHTMHNEQARVFVEKVAENGYFSYVNDNTETVCEPLFLQIGTGEDSGMCYIFRFSNGEFFVVDGGFDDALSSYAHTQSCKRIMAALEQHAQDPQNIRVVGWLITHPHMDHNGALIYYANNYYDYPNVTVENVMYNNYSPAVLLEAELSDSESKYETIMKKLLKAGVKLHRTHTGQVMEFGDAKLEIVYTHEMRMASQKLTSGNGLSIVMRFTVAGQTFLITGDTTTKANRVMEAMYGSALKADFYQAPHHGYGGNTTTLAGLVDPSWVLWPCCDTRYAIVKGFDHNAYFFGPSSTKKQEHFVANNQTYIFQLPFDGTNYTVTANKPIG